MTSVFEAVVFGFTMGATNALLFLYMFADTLERIGQAIWDVGRKSNDE